MSASDTFARGARNKAHLAHSHRFASAFLAAVLVAVLAMLVRPTDATAYYMVDISGAVGDYAAITTILQHNTRAQLKLITVSGTTWGHGVTVAKTVCRFLDMAKPINNVKVALGAVQAYDDAYSSSSGRGGCRSSQGFPLTPHDADIRGMPYSRADVTSLFTAAYELPAFTDSSAYYTLTNDANAALLGVLNSLSSGDTLKYVTLGSLTNLAKFLDYLSTDLTTFSKLLNVLTVHAYESGHNFAADTTAATRVFAQPRLAGIVYTPTFYQPLLFTSTQWNKFQNIADIGTTSSSVRWLFTAWERMRTVVDAAAATNPSASFLQTNGPMACLTVLCAIDDTVSRTCTQYWGSNSSVYTTYTSPSSSTSTVLQLSGNNVTRLLYLQTPAPSITSNAGAIGFRVVSTPATTYYQGYSRLVDVFWKAWMDLLTTTF